MYRSAHARARLTRVSDPVFCKVNVAAGAAREPAGGRGTLPPDAAHAARSAAAQHAAASLPAHLDFHTIG